MTMKFYIVKSFLTTAFIIRDVRDIFTFVTRLCLPRAIFLMQIGLHETKEMLIIKELTGKVRVLILVNS